MMNIQKWLIATALLMLSSVAAGEAKSLYATCASCHGKNAEGSEPLAAPQLAGQGSAYLIEQLVNYRDGYRGTHPDDMWGKMMAASALSLSDDDIETLAVYLSDLTPRPISTDSVGDPDAGKAFYLDNCEACHGVNAQGVGPVYAPNLTILQGWYIRSQLEAYAKDWRGHSTSTTRAKGMRSILGQISNDQQVEDLIAWFATLSK